MKKHFLIPWGGRLSVSVPVFVLIQWVIQPIIESAHNTVTAHVDLVIFRELKEKRPRHQAHHSVDIKDIKRVEITNIIASGFRITPLRKYN